MDELLVFRFPAPNEDGLATGGMAGLDIGESIADQV